MGKPRSEDDLIISLTADIVAAHISHNPVAVDELAQLIHLVHGKLSELSGARRAPKRPEPRVPIRSSVTPHYLICLEDGTIVRTLKRHLMTHHQMTPAQYRAKWGLPAEYPMVAPSYAELRRNIAREMGLGARRRRKPRTAILSNGHK